jgi:DNA gyrase subunit B
MADADVDGSHIRTLLLTFFFRHMPKLIEHGFLYIAQPPLYKVKKGSSEVYLKNEQAWQTYIVDNALSGAVLKSKAGDRSGADLHDFTAKLGKFAHLISGISRVIPSEIAEVLALAGAFDKSWIGNESKTKTLLTKIDKTFAANSDEEVLWKSVATDGGDIEISRETRGVKTPFVIKKSYLDLPEVSAIAQLKEQIAADFEGPVKLLRGEEERVMKKPCELMNAILEIGKKGVTIQRFKGLGEMNAEQLWETTLDPSNRTLLQVKVDQYDEADQTFSVLMGNVVEPRRDFIVENALKVVNLDV